MSKFLQATNLTWLDSTTTSVFQNSVEIFNNFFMNVTKDIGDENINIDKSHPSIIKIEENKTNDIELSFRLTEEHANKQISKLNIKKATGCDSISPKILKLAQPSISNPINILVNKSIESSIFPENLKAAQVSPLFKKNNSLDKGNYRPVSVLPCISKIYERAIHDQFIMDFLDKQSHPLLSAFIPGFGCQTALLKIIEDCNKALDDNKFIAAILMDLSKDFDCLPHNLLLLKLEVYGLSKNSLKLLQSYLENRKHRIKIGSYYSDWDQMCKGVPQGSILTQFFSNLYK